LSARAEAARSPFNLANAMFLLVLSIAVFFAAQVREPRQTATIYNRVATSLKQVVLPRPAAPSAFRQEAAMTSPELMARWEPLIAEAAQHFGISESWLRAVMRMESGGRTMQGENQPITSPVGAVGLMQLMPATYDEMRAQYGLGADATDPHDNVYAGAAYLSWLHKKYGYPAMFAAYNDGPGKLEDHLYRGRALPAETQHYVAGIAGMLGNRVAAATTETAKLTRPDGTPIAIDKGRVRAIYAPLPGEYADSVKSVIAIGKKRQGVRETVTEANALLGNV
jgi:soluble lytic murein transglycosylase-like protein